MGMCMRVFNSVFGGREVSKLAFSVAIQFCFIGWVHVKTPAVVTGSFEKKQWISAKGAKTAFGFSVYFPPKLQVDLRSALTWFKAVLICFMLNV